jgi:hypothetical protein
MLLTQPSAFDIATGSFKTLLGGKNVTFTDTKQESSAPEWARFVVDDDVKIVDRKEVRLATFSLVWMY